jgi:NADH:ubiquinone oxidoreductase subunit 5 (subunit L)/multisubunit Na+/H+ antiporter MnhA subunit
LGVLVYLKGYAVAWRLMAFAPLRWTHTWLYRRMYFDELYNVLVVNLLVLGLARVARAVDRWVIDALIDGAAWAARRLAGLARLSDRYLVDGTVDGFGRLAHDIGAAARAPQTGRIRLYMTVLLVTATVGVAGAIAAVVLAW